MLSHANFELNLRRRELIRPFLRDEYRHLCSSTVPAVPELFGEDVPKLVRDLTEVNKVGRLVNRGKGAYRYRPYHNYNRNQGGFLGRGRKYNYPYNKGRGFMKKQRGRGRGFPKRRNYNQQQ